MDPLSITVSCVSLTAVIAKTTLTVTKFIRDVRGARTDLDVVSRELLSLTTVLELLAEDASDPKNGAFPATLQKQITGIIMNCTGVVVEIQGVLDKHQGTKLTKAAKWVAFGSDDINKLRSSLEAHKSALEIALEMIALTLAREIKADTTELLQDTAEIKEQMTAGTDKIIAEIVRLQEQLPKNPGPASPNTFMLERYLDNLTSYCESTVYDDEERSEIGHGGMSKRSSLEADHNSLETSLIHSSETTDFIHEDYTDVLRLEASMDIGIHDNAPDDLRSEQQEPSAQDTHHTPASHLMSQPDISHDLRKLSDERISTAPEGDKEELELIPIRSSTPQNRGLEEGRQAQNRRQQEPSTQTYTQHTVTLDLTSALADTIISTAPENAEAELHRQDSAETFPIPQPGQNFGIDYPVTEDIARRIPSRTSDKTKSDSVTYSAINCRPVQFYDREFRLRQNSLAPEKLPDVVFKLVHYPEVLTHYPENLPKAKLLRTLQSISQSVSKLDKSWSRYCSVILSNQNTGSDLHSMGITTVTDHATSPGGITMNLFESSLFFNMGNHATDIIFIEPSSPGLVELSSTLEQWLDTIIKELQPALVIGVDVGREVRPSTLKDIRNRAAHEIYGRRKRDGKEQSVYALYEESSLYNMTSKAKGLFGLKA